MALWMWLLHPSTSFLAINCCAASISFVAAVGTGGGWPDVVVAATMACLALQGAALVIRQSLTELRRPAALSANT